MRTILFYLLLLNFELIACLLRCDGVSDFPSSSQAAEELVDRLLETTTDSVEVQIEKLNVGTSVQENKFLVYKVRPRRLKQEGNKNILVLSGLHARE